MAQAFQYGQHEVQIGEISGSQDDLPMRADFSAASLGLQGTVVYVGDANKVLEHDGISGRIGNPQDPKYVIPHGWGAVVYDADGNPLRYTEIASIYGPESDNGFTRTVEMAIENTLESPSPSDRTPTSTYSDPWYDSDFRSNVGRIEAS